ncbi:Imm1 family immunity protein [Saccharothrix sp. HUAS TT1]|uniref:Imm1 family immunity protein n=1 Tax=Saccharothrix sp. HUAS TT1 TaxID=3231910 RepID=UPI00345C214C
MKIDSDDAGGVWVARCESWEPPADAPPLYIDKAVMTEFPRHAVLPLDLWREALHEFMRTGRRPTCVEWDVSAVY